MKKKEWNEGLDHLDPDLVEKYVEQKDRLRQKKNQKSRWLRFGAIAACFALIVGIVFASGVLDFGGALPDDGSDAGKTKEVLPLEYLLGSTDFDRIIWGDGVNLNPDNENADVNPVIPGDGDNNSPLYDDSWIEWNGIKITKSLYGGLTDLEANTLIAITARSLTPAETLLADYEYQGKTYSAIRDELEAAKKIRFALQQIKDFSHYYDENYEKWIKDSPDEFWEKVYGNLDKEFLHDNNYIIGDQFNVNLISDDLNEYETVCNQLENDLNQCEREYRAKYAPKIDWDKLAQEGFDVYHNQGTYLVVLIVGSMDTFADCVAEVYASEVISDTVFRYATHAELGLPSPDIPNDDGQDIVPGGVVDIPLDEEPIADDVAIEN